MPENQHASWFRTEFKELQEIHNKSGDELRLAMFHKGFIYLQDIMDTPMPSWRENENQLMMS